MATSIFASIELAPPDPILGITEALNADPTARTLNLGVGVYYDDGGKLPVLECVRRAEKQLAENPAPRGYLPIDGIPGYVQAVQQLVLGADSAALKDARVVGAQMLGGTGALKVA